MDCRRTKTRNEEVLPYKNNSRDLWHGIGLTLAGEGVWGMALFSKGLVFLLLISGDHAWPISTETLPERISSPILRYGVISGLSGKFDSQGRLVNLGDSRSVSFDAATLSKVSPEARALVQALNKIGSQGLGDQINLGTLRIDTQPELRYWAPILAHGVLNTWTLALGVPIVTYKNKISLSHEKSNLDFYRAELSQLSDEFNEALNINLVNEAQATLREKGYRPLENRDETFLGDMQFISLWRFYDGPSFRGALRSQLTLPTGPKPNSDDLMAPNVFHRSGVENKFILEKPLGLIALKPYIGFAHFLTQNYEARVPKNEDDSLPDASQKEVVRKNFGLTTLLGGEVEYAWSDSLSFWTGVERSAKASDSYGGSRNLRYDLLARNSDSLALKSRVGFSFSTVKDYFKSKAALPAMASLEFSDTFLGKNVERMMVTEFNLMMFF